MEAYVIATVIFVLVVLVTSYVLPPAKKYIDTHTSSAERTIIYDVAHEAVLFTEQNFPALEGAAKMVEASKYVNAELERLHIPLTAQTIEGIVEQAYAGAKKSGILELYHLPEPSVATTK
ncbi:MAG: phage holin [Patescibacteria group bacterium]|nr:phage holin [Patescibacteria group bacterium]